jgi:hypothetical protein
VSCAADIVLCTGVSTGGNGVGGTFAATATSDGRGSLALGCGNSEVGPRLFESLFVPTPAGFVSKSSFGYHEPAATQDGFITISQYLPPTPYEFRAHDGDVLGTQDALGGRLFAGLQSIVLVRVAAQGKDTVITAQAFRADGSAAGIVSAVATLAGVPAGSVMLGGGADVQGNTLPIWAVYGQQGASARWLGPDASPRTRVFAIADWLDHVPEARALAGAGLAIPADGSGPFWRGVVESGATAEQPAPQWLASRRGFALMRGGRAMAFGKEILAPGGTRCGTLDLGAPLLGVGLDGTAVTARDQKTFRVYPQLLR